MIKVTTDHSEIKSWAEKHGGKPYKIDDPSAGGDKTGLKIDFPGEKDEGLLSNAHPPSQITWDEFFKLFEEQKLALSYENDAENLGTAELVDAYRFLNR